MKKKEKRYSLRASLIAFFVLATCINFLVGLYNIFAANISVQDISRLVDTGRSLSKASQNISTLQGDMETYLFSRSTFALQSYYNSRNLVQADITLLQEKATYTESGIRHKNLAGLLGHYLDTVEQVMSDKRNERAEEYIAGYQLATQEYQYIIDYIKTTMYSDLLQSTAQLDTAMAEVQTRNNISYTLFFSATGLVIIMILLFSFQTTQPIMRLAEHAKSVSDGNYDIDIKTPDTGLEVSALYSSFDIMVQSTKLYVDSLREKQVLEQELAQQKIEGLEMHNALQVAELHALHAQMNPHFIFNTINIGAKIAMMQGDDVLCEYLENAADVFRYNLAGLDEATLQEEISNVKAYMNLLTTRFGEKLIFTCNCETDIDMNCYTLPRMTLQPLVENAFVHGVSQIETTGIISLDATQTDDAVVICISNNGNRFPAEKIKTLSSGSPEPKQVVPPGHVSGIGLFNVIKRLRLHFQTDRLLTIESNDHLTKVTLTLPLPKKEG